MATWPTTLPAPSPAGYSINPVMASVRTEMDSGAARSRRRTHARNDKVSAVWDMTDAQLVIFRAWYDDDAAGAAGGSAFFTVDLAIGAGGLTSTTARFVSGYQVAYTGFLRWDVSAELEIR